MDRLHVPVDAIPKSATGTAASVTVTVTGQTGKRIVVFGFAGSALAQKLGVELKFASTVKWSLQGLADTPIGKHSVVGWAAADGETVTVVTTPAASALCKANIEYIFVVT